MEKEHCISRTPGYGPHYAIFTTNPKTSQEPGDSWAWALCSPSLRGFRPSEHRALPTLKPWNPVRIKNVRRRNKDLVS